MSYTIIDQSKNGVNVKIYRFQHGTTISADCSCFGMPFRTHSTEDCPVLIKRRQEIK
jgi:hypothetical protein